MIHLIGKLHIPGTISVPNSPQKVFVKAVWKCILNALNSTVEMLPHFFHEGKIENHGAINF